MEEFNWGGDVIEKGVKNSVKFFIRLEEMEWKVCFVEIRVSFWL